MLGKKNVSFIWKFTQAGKVNISNIDAIRVYRPFEKFTVSLKSSLGVNAVKQIKIIRRPPKKISTKMSAFHIFHIFLKINIKTLTLWATKQNINRRGCLNKKIKNRHKNVRMNLSFIAEGFCKVIGRGYFSSFALRVLKINIYDIQDHCFSFKL